MLNARSRGFTLLELMLVIGVIGVLAATAIPAYQDYTIRARVAEGFVLAEEAEVAVAHYYDRWGALPQTNAMAGLPESAAMRGVNVEAVSIENGAIVVRFGGKSFEHRATPALLVLHPAINVAYPTGPLAWVCNERAAPSGFRYGDPGPSKTSLANPVVPAVCRI